MSNRAGPVNASSAPWAHTAQGFGLGLEHHLVHDIVQHPNPLHSGMPAVSPFRESVHAQMGRAGQARHWPAFSAPGLFRSTRK